jgi:hypothetical protein
MRGMGQGGPPGMGQGGMGGCGMCPMMPPQGGPPEGRGPMMRPQAGPPEGRGPMMRPQAGPPEGRGLPEGRGPMMRPPAAPQGPAPVPGASARPQSRLFGFPGGRVETEVTPGEGAGRLMRLIGPEARERLGLSDQQVERIRGILSGIRENAGQMAERMRGAMKDVPPQERAERMRDMLEKGAAERARRVRGAEEAVMKVLSPEQREKFERWQRERGPEAGQPSAPSERPRPENPPPGRMRSRPGDSPAAAPPPAAPAVQQEPARFHFVQWNQAGGSITLNSAGGAANPEQGRAARENRRIPDELPACYHLTTSFAWRAISAPVSAANPGSRS